MVYLVTGQPDLFENPNYKLMSVEESLQLLSSCKILQYDSETTGVDARICDLLCVQFGNKEKDFQIVVDTTTVSILLYKSILEDKYITSYSELHNNRNRVYYHLTDKGKERLEHLITEFELGVKVVKDFIYQ